MAGFWDGCCGAGWVKPMRRTPPNFDTQGERSEFELDRRAALGLGLSCWVASGCDSRRTPAKVPSRQLPQLGAAARESETERESPSFKRGLNLGNALDAPAEGEWGVTLSEGHFEAIARAGLDHVRLPVRFSAHAGAEAPFSLEPAFMARVDWALEQAKTRGLSVILDFHHYNELMEAPAAHRDRFLAIWKQVAERYQTAPDTIAFELLNEPCKELTPVLLNPLMAQAISAVRATNPTRRVIVDSYAWAAAEQLSQLTLPDDPNVMASFHMYQPLLFTHQGAHWMGPEYQTRGIVFPGPPAQPIKPVVGAESVDWVKNWLKDYNSLPTRQNPCGERAIVEQFELATAYEKQTGRRVYMGEFGAIDVADAASREKFLKVTRREAERGGFGWAYWDDGGRFRGWDVRTSSWVPEIQRGLFE